MAGIRERQGRDKPRTLRATRLRDHFLRRFEVRSGVLQTERNSAPRHRLQALEGQALGVLDPGQIEPADEATAASRSQSVNATTASTAIRWASMGFLVLSVATGRAAWVATVNPALTIGTG